jgi:thermostable 8-oxoguanine DNA glycosylase
MKINWEISESDIKKVVKFVDEHKNPNIVSRINRNIERRDIQIDKDTIIKTMLMCLMTSPQGSDPESSLIIFFRKKPFLLTYKFLYVATDIEYAMREVLKANGLTRYINKIPKYFSYNFYQLVETNWDLEIKLVQCLKQESTIEAERELADGIDQVFKGFGSKQARNFLQSLGLTKYEIPIDSQVISWLKEFDFPILVSATALQDKAFYHFVSDGIQLLCRKANIYPCILEAAISTAMVSGSLTMDNNPS